MPWRVFLFVAAISCGLWPAMRLLWVTSTH
jgi:hypothetical protein